LRMHIVGVGVLGLREEVADFDVPLGLCLEDAGPHGPDVEVLPVGGFDQGIEL